MSYKTFCDYCEEELTFEERNKTSYPRISYGLNGSGFGYKHYDQCQKCAGKVAEFVSSLKVKHDADKD